MSKSRDKFRIHIRVPMTILVILIIFIAIICGILAYQRVDREGFDLGPNTELSTCPLQSKAYLAKNGDTLCCEGSLSPEGDCTKPLCALAPRKDMPSCKAMLDAANQKMASICPPSLPNYYTDGMAITGCTDGALNNERTAPISASSKTCKVYSNTPLNDKGLITGFTLNDVRMDSCTIQKRKENGKKQMSNLFGSKLVDFAMVLESGSALMGLTTYTSPIATVPQTCISKDVLIYKMQRIPLGSNPSFSTEAGRQGIITMIKQGLYPSSCEAQKAIHFDKSTTAAELMNQMKLYVTKHPNMQIKL